MPTTQSINPVTAYQLYKADSDVIQRAKDANPDYSDNKVLLAFIKDSWKNLSAIDRQPWEEKRRYLSGDEETTPTATDTDKSTKDTPSSIVTEETARIKVKARTNYMIYINNPANRQNAIEKHQSENPTEKPLAGRNLVKVLAAQWSSLSDEERKPYDEQFEKEKADLEENPKWKEVTKKKKQKKAAVKDITTVDPPANFGDIRSMHHRPTIHHEDTQFQSLKNEVSLLKQQVGLLTQILEKLSTQ